MKQLLIVSFILCGLIAQQALADCADLSGYWEGQCTNALATQDGKRSSVAEKNSITIIQTGCNYLTINGEYTIPADKTSASIEPFPKFHYFYTVSADWNPSQTVFNWVTTEHIRSVESTSDVSIFTGKGAYWIVNRQLNTQGKTHVIEMKNKVYSERDEASRCVFSHVAKVSAPLSKITPAAHWPWANRFCRALRGKNCDLK